MSSRRGLAVSAILLIPLIGGCGILTGTLGSTQCSGGAVLNALPGTLIQGTIKDVYRVSRLFSNPSYSNTQEDAFTQLTAHITLQIQDGDGNLAGTARVTWVRLDQFHFRQRDGVCADGMFIDSNIRVWTVNLAGRIFCDNEGKVGVMATGTPDGSDIPTTYRYHEYGCHAGCPPCYDVTNLVSERVTWSSLDERGFEDQILKRTTHMPVPAGHTGEWYHEVMLTISLSTTDAE